MIDVERHDTVAVVRLDHGPVNALDLELLHAITATFGELADDDTEAVVLTGAGRSFSAGVDLRRVLDGGPEYLEGFLPALTEAFETVFRFPRPVVVAVNGHAIAGGCIFTCAGDRRLMAAGDGRIGVTELLVGVAFPTAALEILRFAAGTRTAELVLTGATFPPEEAVIRGLVDEVVPAGELAGRAVDEARRLAAIPRRTFLLTKRQLRREAIDTIAQNAPRDDAHATEIWGSAETLERMRSYLEALRHRPR